MCYPTNSVGEAVNYTMTSVLITHMAFLVSNAWVYLGYEDMVYFHELALESVLDEISNTITSIIPSQQ